MHKELLEDLMISSPVFKHGGLIPQQYSCEGSDTNPPLKIDGIPVDAAMLVLIMEDIDSPNSVFDHWIIWNLNTSNTIEEKRIKGALGKNNFNQNTYIPPSTTFGIHRYSFKLYVLDTAFETDENTRKENLLQSIAHHVIAKAEIMGRYQQEYNWEQNSAVA